MGKSRLYRNGAHGNKEEGNKKKMRKGKSIDDRDPEPQSSRGKKRAEFKQILADKGEEMYMKMKQRDGGVHISNSCNDVFTSDQNIRPTERISNHRLNDETHQGDSFQKFVVLESARHITMRELGYLWRSSKSRFSKIIASCVNEEERMEKRPKNIKLEWWKSL
ncbi:hypothetical protein IFM89_027983 [Coptis chinensis]|uniref:Uncharacterized protein n=1 Tax=Coptis chinensis TaxID=261450 RepID=A0A835H2W2_9MAGN|nr:hypothetical protein IFM89_027983 [Coptis chinensis]